MRSPLLQKRRRRLNGDSTDPHVVAVHGKTAAGVQLRALIEEKAVHFGNRTNLEFLQICVYSVERFLGNTRLGVV